MFEMKEFTWMSNTVFYNFCIVPTVFGYWIAIQTHLVGSRMLEASRSKRTVEHLAQQTKTTSEFSEV
jgi:hypothetical protein